MNWSKTIQLRIVQGARATATAMQATSAARAP